MTDDGLAADLVQREMIAAQYRQANTNIASENVVLAYMAATALLGTSWKVVVGWVAVELSTQVYRTIRMIRRFERGEPATNFTAYWARHHQIYQTLIGIVWGSSMFLFAHQDDPVSITLTLCGLVIIASGAVPGIAYNPPALWGFCGFIFVIAAARLLLFGGTAFVILGISCLFYCGVLILMCTVQTRTIADGIQIRFENKQLLDALTGQKATAEAAQAQAEAANLAKSQFLAAASHDLRQPLYALSLLSGMLRGLTVKRDGVEVIDQIEANVGALESLFNGLLDISRLDAGVMTIAPEPIMIDELFDRLEHYLRPIAQESGLELRFRSDGTWVASDRILLEQILTNLGTNALRNTQAGGVLIAARRRGDRVRLEVWDTGCGIAPGNRERIFDEFIQVGNPERSRRKGMGLGLAIVKRSVLLLGSRVEVRSTVGRGSVFLFDQPRAPAQPLLALPLPTGAAGATLTGKTVLVVEDDGGVRHALGALLRQWGVIADLAHDDASARQRIAEHRRYALALIDYRLPGPNNGLDIIAALKAQGCVPDDAIYLVTGDMDADILIRANLAGVSVLHKPLQPSRLRELIAAARA